MQNPKTTIAGYAIIVAACLTLVAHFLSGGGVNMADIAAVLAALNGAGLVMSKDGSH